MHEICWVYEFSISFILIVSLHVHCKNLGSEVVILLFCGYSYSFELLVSIFCNKKNAHPGHVEHCSLQTPALLCGHDG